MQDVGNGHILHVNESHEESKNEEQKQDVDDFCDEEPEFLRFLREQGKGCKLGPLPDPGTRPSWLDLDKFKAGQKFACEYYACISFAETCSLVALFLFDDGLKPLIWTGASGTPYTAFRRYLSTALKVKSWFETDVWSEDSDGFKNVRIVNAMHTRVSREVNDRQKADKRLPLPPIPPPASCCAMAPVLRAAAEAASCSQKTSRCPQSVIYFSQSSLSVTQWGFVGMIVTFPGCFGAGSASDAQLEAFLHLWRAIGFLLGIEDRFNFCSGSLEEVRERCRGLIKHWIVPELGRVSDEWEHYSRCMCRGISFYVKDVSFEVVLVYFCWTVGVDIPQLQSALTWMQYLKLQFFKFFLCFALRVPFVLTSFNWAVKKSVAKASKFSEDKLVSLQNKTLCECRR